MTDTPTPQMTPEQRAVLVAELRLPWFTNGCEWYQVRAANSLEADGVTIATLTAERDAAQTDLKAADAQIELLLKNHNGLTAEIARLTAALATAREDGLREAANRLQDVLDRRVSKKMTRGNDTVANCITIIRSAIQKGAAT